MERKDEARNEGSRGYIHERIIPRKKTKKVLLIIAATIGLAFVFGGVAAVTFSAGQRLLFRDNSEAAEPIVIARDDTTEAETPETLPEIIEETEAETVIETEAAEEESVPDEKEEAEVIETENAGDETEDTESAQEEEAASASESVSGLKTLYEKAKDAFLTVTASIETDSDWFGTQVVSRKEIFGVMAVNSEDSIFILTDAGAIPEDAALSAVIHDRQVPLEIQETDAITHLCVLKADKALLPEDVTVLELGNSFDLDAADDVYMFGAPFGFPGAMDRGIVTYAADREAATDGYAQLLYTDMQRAYGGSAVLLNSNGQIVGWMSDYSAGRGNIAVACGISPLKYIIEDLCIGASTAYLGVNCKNVFEEDAKDSGIPAGLYVTEVIEESPAYTAGIQTGDILVSVNGKTLSDNHVLQLRLDDLQADSDVTIKIKRKSAEAYEETELPVHLGGR